MMVGFRMVGKGQRQFCLALLTGLLVLIPRPGLTYLLEAPHLLELVTSTIKEPNALVVQQKRIVLNLRETPDFQGEIRENLWFSFPGRYRCEIVSEDHTRLSVFSDGNFLKVVDGQIVAILESPADLYMDILLFRDRVTLGQRLEAAGVNTRRVSLQRYQDTICYVLGDLGSESDPSSSLWIEKSSFFPLRYLVNKEGWSVEIHYSNWQRFSRTWYPMEICIFLDKAPFALVSVEQVNVESNFPESAFDIDGLLALYPKSESFNTGEGSDRSPGSSPDNGMDEIQQRIEQFKTIYE